MFRICDSTSFRARLLFYLLVDAAGRAPLSPRALRTARPSAFRRSRVPPTHGKGRRRTSLRPETANALAPRTIVEMPAACVAPAAAFGAAAASRRQGSPLRARAAAKQGAIPLATKPRLQARDAGGGSRRRRRPSPRARRARRADPRLRSRRHDRDSRAFVARSTSFPRSRGAHPSRRRETLADPSVPSSRPPRSSPRRGLEGARRRRRARVRRGHRLGRPRVWFDRDGVHG